MTVWSDHHKSGIFSTTKRKKPEKTNHSSTDDTYSSVQKYDNQLNESQQRQVAFKLEELKQGVLYPYTTNEEYKNLMFEYSVINQTGMAKTGVVITKNEQYGGVEIKPLTERYKNAINEVKQSNNLR